MEGDRERQEVADFYVAAREGVIRYLIASGLSADRATEAAQEAFLKFYLARRNAEEIREPRSWVYRVARNIAIDRIRRDPVQSPLTEAVKETVAAAGSSVEQRMIDEQWMEGFRAAMKHLSERQRLCLELRSQGLHYREIADVLEIQISTVAEYVRRGIEELKKWNRCRS
jgi:RNA polymerase sigma-70 factor (ECF subfamily)